MRTSEFDHVRLPVLAGIVDNGFGVRLDDGVHKLIPKGLSDIRCRPKQAEEEGTSGS